MTSQMVPLGADEDPCREFTCSSQSYCQVNARGEVSAKLYKYHK